MKEILIFHLIKPKVPVLKKNYLPLSCPPKCANPQFFYFQKEREASHP